MALRENIGKNLLERPKKYLSEVLFLLGDDKRLLPVIGFLYLGASVLDLVGIGLVAPYIALVIEPDVSTGGGLLRGLMAIVPTRWDLESTVGLLLIAIFIIKAAVAIALNRATIGFSQRQQVKLRSMLIAAYLALPYKEYLQRNSAEYVHNMQTLASQYASVVLTPCLRIASDLIVAIVIVAFLAWTNFLAFSLMMGLFGFAVLIYDRAFRAKLRMIGTMANVASQEIIRTTQESMSGIKDIRMLGAEAYFSRKLRSASSAYAASATAGQVISTAPRYLLDVLLVVFIITFVSTARATGGDAQAITPVLTVFGVAALRLLPMVSAFSNSLGLLRYYRHVPAVLSNDLKNMQQVRVPEPETLLEVGEFRELKLTEVCFRYPGADSDTLHNVSLEIRAGECIGIVGASGAGKTTLVDVILGLLTPKEGMVLHNGRPIGQTSEEWRRQVAYLPQQVFLTDDTLMRNVALGIEDGKIDESRVGRALMLARNFALVEQLPGGLNTLIGDRGFRLSGGQRQRVALARAFYHNRQVLVLDEATSALDAELEREISQEIRSLKGTITIIVIAHRPSTLESCDRLFKLDAGRIVGVGTPKELLG